MCTFLVASCPWQHKYNFRQFCVCVPIQAGNVSWFLCVSMTSFHAVLLCYLFKNFHNDHLNEILWNLFGKCSSKRRFFCFGGWDAVLSKHPSNKKRLKPELGCTGGAGGDRFYLFEWLLVDYHSLGSSPPWPSAALLWWAAYSWWLTNTAWGGCLASGGWVAECLNSTFRLGSQLKAVLWQDVETDPFAL